MPLRLSLQSISSVLHAVAGIALASRIVFNEPSVSAISSSFSLELELAVESSSNLYRTSAILAAPVLKLVLVPTNCDIV